MTGRGGGGGHREDRKETDAFGSVITCTRTHAYTHAHARNTPDFGAPVAYTVSLSSPLPLPPTSALCPALALTLGLGVV